MNKKGQSIIEYVLIAVLVILGIVFMGPYVLRSINAHFKFWDEGVRDSFEENLNQANIDVLPPMNNTCDCTPSAGSCGGPGLPCIASEREYDYLNCSLGCTPPASYCVNDDSCCQIYYSQGCGQTPVGLTPPAGDCNVGQRISATLCGDMPIQCNADPSYCSPPCLGSYDSTAAQCPGEWPPAVTLTTYKVGVRYVATAADCNDVCQVYCVPPAILNPTGTGCEAPATCSGTVISPNDGIPLFVPSQISSNYPNIAATIQNLNFEGCLKGTNCSNGGSGWSSGWGPPSSNQMKQINYVSGVSPYSSSSGVTTGWAQQGTAYVYYFYGSASSGTLIAFGSDAIYTPCLPFCSANSVYQGTCDAGYYYQGTCDAGYFCNGPSCMN